MEPAWILSAVVLAATVVQASTGFGFSIIATPFLVLLLDPKTGIQVNLCLSFVLSLTMLPIIWKDTERDILKSMIPAALVAAPVGGLLIASADDRLLYLLIGLVLVSAAVTTLKKIIIRPTLFRGISAGAASGALTTALGMPGPPVLVYLASVGCGAKATRATALSFFVIVYAIAICAQVFLDQMRIESVGLAVAYVPAMLVGAVAGHLLVERINGSWFNRAIALILVASGLFLIANAAAPELF